MVIILATGCTKVVSPSQVSTGGDNQISDQNSKAEDKALGQVEVSGKLDHVNQPQVMDLINVESGNLDKKIFVVSSVDKKIQQEIAGIKNGTLVKITGEAFRNNKINRYMEAGTLVEGKGWDYILVSRLDILTKENGKE